MAENPLKYSDLLQPDNSIENAISQLKELNQTYSDTLQKVKSEAIKLQAGIEGVSGATEEQREKIKQTTKQVDVLAEAEKKLQFALSDTAKEIAVLKEQQREQANLNKIMARLNNSMEGSYDHLSAQYSLNKMKLNKLSQEYRENTENGKKLVKETEEIYARMKQLQEATGKYTLNVGNYKSAWDGLGVSAAQLVRELPSLAVSANTFFLAISNNIPMLVDEINKLKAANAAAAAAGEATVPVWKSVAKAFLSWNTLMSVGITLITVYGKDIVNYTANLFKSAEQIKSAAEYQKSYNEAIKEGTKEAQKDISKLNILYQVSQDNARSIEDRKKAIVGLKREYPEYFKNLSDEEVLAGNAATKYLELKNNILEVAKAKAIEKKVAEYGEKIVENDEKKAKLQEDYNKAYREYIDLTSGAGNTSMGIGLEAAGYDSALRSAMGKVNKAREEINKLDEETKQYNETILKLGSGINIDALLEEETKKTKEKNKTIKDNTLEYQREAEDARLNILNDGMDKEIQLSNLKYTREIEDLKNRLKTEKNLTEQAKEAIMQTISAKNIKMAQEEEKIRKQYADKELKEQEKQQKEANKLSLEQIEQEKDLRISEIDIMITTEAEKTKLRLQAEKERINKILDLYKKGQKTLSDLEVQTLENILKKLDQEISSNEKKTGKKDIYDLLGINLSDEKKQAISESVGFTISQLQSLLSAQMEMKEAALQAAQEETEAAQNRLDQEIEARNNGYANDVLTAQKELALAKQKEQQALKEKQKAQRQEQALDTLTQTSSLVTASANIWKSLSGIPIVGYLLAIAAIATMWSSFAAAKVKARQATKTEYGEGGMEFLEGGSHQSGNDIDLGTTPDGKQRRAEGGEAFAVINKKSTRKYRKALPGIIKSINNGTFEKKYLNAFGSDGIAINVNGVSFSSKELEKDVKAIKEQGKKRYYTDGKGRIVERYKNLTRVYN